MKIGIEDHSDESETDEEELWVLASVNCMTPIYTATVCDDVGDEDEDPDSA